MWAYALRRLLAVVPTLFGVTLVTFFISASIPGDPAVLVVGQRASPETLERVRHEMGLDRPLPVRYLGYLRGLARGELGRSLRTQRPVAGDLRERFPATLELTAAAMAFAVVAGTLLGTIAAVRGRLWDTLTRMVAVAGISTPVFWWGLLLVLLFYRELGWLPAQGRFDPFLDPPPAYTGLHLIDALLSRDWQALVIACRYLVLPAFTLGSVQLALVARMVRTGMLDVLREEFVRTARAKGLTEPAVVFRHALKNATVPALTAVGLAFGELLGGAVLTETIFGWPGMGKYAVDSIGSLDYPAILGFTLVVGAGFALINLAVDLLYAVVDPRIRYG